MHNESILYIDIYCYKCKRLCAFTNTIENDGKRYCYNCHEYLFPELHDLNYLANEIYEIYKNK